MAKVSITTNRSDILEISKKVIGSLKAKMMNNSSRFRTAIEKSIRTELIEMVAVGADVMRMTKGGTPPNAELIEKAYTEQFPGKAEEWTFAEAFSSFDNDEARQGFLAGVKGKLFEFRVLEDLQLELANDNLTAELALSPNQADWDITIKNFEGEIVDKIQVKATDDASLVKEAASQNPDIGLITTDEVYDNSPMLQEFDTISSSGITNAEVTGKVADAAEAISAFSVPFFAFAIILGSEMVTGFDRRRAWGRIGRSSLSTTAGFGLAAITGLWWMGVTGAMISRYLLGRSSLQPIRDNDPLFLLDYLQAVRELQAEDKTKESYGRALTVEIELAELKSELRRRKSNN